MRQFKDNSMKDLQAWTEIKYICCTEKHDSASISDAIEHQVVIRCKNKLHTLPKWLNLVELAYSACTV